MLHGFTTLQTATNQKADVIAKKGKGILITLFGDEDGRFELSMSGKKQALTRGLVAAFLDNEAFRECFIVAMQEIAGRQKK